MSVYEAEYCMLWFQESLPVAQTNHAWLQLVAFDLEVVGERGREGWMSAWRRRNVLVYKGR